MLELLFSFMFICFRHVFHDIWWMVLCNCGRELTVGFPRKGGVWFLVQRCAHRSSPCPRGCSEACHFISLQLSTVSSCFLTWCTSSLAMLQILPSMESSPQQFHTNYFMHTQKSLHSALQPCVLPNQIQGLFLSITWFLLPLKYITVFI